MRLMTGIILLIFSCFSSEASQGNLLGAMYFCVNMQERTSFVVGACSSEYPELSGRANVALEAWLKRNSSQFARVSQQCEVEFRKLVPDPAEFESRTKSLKGMFDHSYKRSIKLNGIAGCEKDLSSIENESNDLAIKYPKPPAL